MSYTRSYRESITVSGSESDTFSYPASENGGSKTVTIHYTKDVPVEVNIFVDTNPFERSISKVKGNVDLLTGAVVATETAEIISKEKNAKKVGKSIVKGFFSYIKSEISQQISELTQNVNAQLVHLKELSQSCLSKKKQMEGDFNRIASRYVKIFEDLNHELSNRILELDKAAFVFKKETDNSKVRTTNNDLVNTIAISGKEGCDLQAQISASISKKRAFDTINKAIIFLRQQNRMNETIQKSTFNESISNSIYLTICYIETKN